MLGFGKDKEKRPDQPTLPRLKTGVPRLDFILKGGFVRGGIYVVMGNPGTGKTIFANQTAFHVIRNDETARCVYVTLLVESVTKMFAHLSSLDFFEPHLAPERLSYVSGYSILKSEGLPGTLKLLRTMVNDHRPQLLVIDGLQTIAQAAESEPEFKEFLHELQAFTHLLGTTTLLLTQSDEGSHHPENAVVDGVVELCDKLVGPRAVRELIVHKFRGSDYLRGRHEVEITSGGVQIHPRTEIQFNEPPEHATEERLRMGFGIKELDQMLKGGPLSGSTTALVGSPGTGKTFLGLSFLVEGAKQGQKGVYFGFYEPPPRLCEKAANVGLDLEKYVESGMIELIWQPPLEHYLDSLAEQLLEKLRVGDKEESNRRRRLFIDGVEGFRAATVYGDRVPRFLSALTNQLRTLDITTLISEELHLFKPEIEMPTPELANVVESVILLRYVELRSQLHRLISVMKMRESLYDTSIREFKIEDTGVVVANSFESAEQILSGHGTVRGDGGERR